MKMNENSMEDPIIKESLCSKFENQRDYSWRQKKQGIDYTNMEKMEMHEMTIDDYRNECSVLPEDERNSISADLLPDVNDLSHYVDIIHPRGSRFFVVALPFLGSGETKDDMGTERWKEFLEKKAFIRYLNMNPSYKNITSGLTDIPIFFYDYLPAEIKNDIEDGGCSFMLDYPYPEGSVLNKYWFLSKCEVAINNLGKLIRNERTDLSSYN